MKNPHVASVALTALVVALVLPLLWMSLAAAPRLRVDVGVWGDHTLLRGIHGVEQGAGEDYRWTAGRAELTLPNLSAHYQELRLRAHGWRPDVPPPQLRLEVAGASWGAFTTTPTMRVYRVLLPRDGWAFQRRVGFESAVFTPPGDPRQLGFAIDWVELAAIGARAAPNPWHLAGQALLLASLALLTCTLGLPRAWPPVLTALFGGLIVWANLRQPLWVSQAIGPWLIVAALLLAATLLLAPRFQRAFAPWMAGRHARLAWALLVAALALRLAGSVHPLFNAHDVDVHMRWIGIVGGGELYLYSTPSEFQNRQTFNPPAGYVLLLPLRLLFDPRLAVQIGVALFDTLGCLLLLALARELGLPARAGLLALALSLALPIGMTMLWWGFAANAIAQSLGLLLVWVLLRLARRPERGAWALVAVPGALALLTHVGALALTAALLGAWLALGWRRVPPAARRPLIGGLALALLFAAILYFSVAVVPLLGQRSARTPALSAPGGSQAEWSLRFSLAARGAVLGFLPLPLALAPLGLLWLLRSCRGSPLACPLLIAWSAVCLAFFGAYLALGLLARYLSFAAPLLCLATGALLAALARRPGGRAAALAVVLLVAWIGVALWVAGVLLRVKPSALPLTH